MINVRLLYFLVGGGLPEVDRVHTNKDMVYKVNVVAVTFDLSKIQDTLSPSMAAQTLENLTYNPDILDLAMSVNTRDNTPPR